jgi:hypothetical protein
MGLNHWGDLFFPPLSPTLSFALFLSISASLVKCETPAATFLCEEQGREMLPVSVDSNHTNKVCFQTGEREKTILLFIHDLHLDIILEHQNKERHGCVL